MDKMELQKKLKAVAEDVHAVVVEAAGIGSSDSYDVCPTERDDEVTFNLSEWIDVPNPAYKGRGPGRTLPIGRVIYTVSVSAAYVPFDEDESVQNTPTE